MKPKIFAWSAEFSPCRTYRYTLTRTWDDEFRPCAFIGLNPSTADESTDDPTIRRCIRFAKDWGYGGLIMLNLFAVRSTDPFEIYRNPSPIGPDNDAYISNVLSNQCAGLVCAWGNHGTHFSRGDHVRELISKLATKPTPTHLGLTKSGQPKHPLYLRADIKPRSFVA